MNTVKNKVTVLPSGSRTIKKKGTGPETKTELKYVSQENLELLATLNSCSQIINNKVKGTIIIEGIEYVVTSICSKGAKTLWVSAFPIVDIDLYTGELKPLDYWGHVMAVSKGERERGYIGKKVNVSKNRVVVIIGPETYGGGSI